MSIIILIILIIMIIIMLIIIIQVAMAHYGSGPAKRMLDSDPLECRQVNDHLTSLEICG